MKNKIRCLFENITSEDLLGIFGICICALLLFTMVFAPISASAYTYSEYPITLAFGNLGNVPYEGVYVNTYNGELGEMGTITVTQPMADANGNVGVAEFYTLDGQQYCRMDGIEIPLTYNVDIPNGSYYICATAFVASGTHAFFTGVGLSTGTAGGLAEEQDIFVHFELNTGNVFTLDTASWHTGEYEHMTVILTPIDTGGDAPTECPSLQTQINQYQGSWNDFEGMLLGSTNEVIYQGYRNKLQELYRQGENSVTLENLLAQYDGSFQQLITLLSENNLRLLDEYAEYVQQTRDDGYNEGYYIGEENGYKNGYNSGLNKGQSDTFTKNFFTDFLGGVVEAIDSIHLYEHIREIDGGVSTVVEWYISPWTIFTSMICLIVVIIILKVWLGG